MTVIYRGEIPATVQQKPDEIVFPDIPAFVTAMSTWGMPDYQLRVLLLLTEQLADVLNDPLRQCVVSHYEGRLEVLIPPDIELRINPLGHAAVTYSPLDQQKTLDVARRLLDRALAGLPAPTR